MIRLALCIAALAAASPAHAAERPLGVAEGPADLAAGLDLYARKALADWDVPGAAVVVVRGGETLLQRGYGVREAGTTRAVNERTLFNIGSATKPFTTALLAQLVEEKKLGWDDPVSRHLPDLALPPYAPDVTLRDLASHRSGWGAASYNFIGLDRPGLLARIRHLPQAAPFRSRLVYNNLGYSVLGEAVAKAAGSSWEQLLRTRLFEPLGMADAEVYSPEVVELDGTARPHARISGKVGTIEPFALDAVAPAGGIYASARDMAAWMRMLLSGGMAGERRLLQEGSIRLMQHMHMPLPVSGIAKVWPSTHFYGYGLGWFVRDYRSVKVVEHGGNTAGMTSFVLLVPELKFGVTVMANADQTEAPTAIAYRALDLALGGESRDVGAVLLASREAEKAAPSADKSAALPLDHYAGTYVSPLYGPVRIVRNGTGLAIDVHPKLRGRLIPMGEHQFDVVWANPYVEQTGIYSPVRFELSQAGTPSRLVIDKLSTLTSAFERQQ